MVTLYGGVSTFGDNEYNDILNSDLSKEEKRKRIQAIGQRRDDEIQKQLYKDTARMIGGTLLSDASFLPIFNIPYVGTGLGGAMFDAGQAIVEGDKLNDIAKRAGRGFAIGETVGAVPYVGKAASKTKAGQAVLNSAPVKAVSNALDDAAQKFAQTKAYDALMTDIKAFNPNKQTVYHGSPYDFNKFSNEAIGTGEGAQAHGYGHYAALNKDVAQRYKDDLSRDVAAGKLSAEIKPFDYSDEVIKEGENVALYLDEALTGEKGKNRAIIHANKKREELLKSIEDIKKRAEKDVDFAFGIRPYLEKEQQQLSEINSVLMYLDDLDKIDVKILGKNPGQLYKLSIPKNDVMLREGATFAQQPKKVQYAIEKELKEQLGTFNYSDEELESLKNLIIHQNPEKLSKYGVKGISYNGGIDGEANVIFNPDDIDIVRKYYNQPNLYEQLTGKLNTGALYNALLNR